MKNIPLSTLICLAVISVVSCSKNSGTLPDKLTSSFIISSRAGGNVNKGNAAVVITGNWKVISDYSYSYEIGDSAETYHSNTYQGTSADYYKFTGNGDVYIKEGIFYWTRERLL